MSLISLVLATYGRCDDVGRMLNSLVAQTDKDFEVLIVDQNADERLNDIVALGLAAGLTLKHIRMDHPSLSGARNVGISQADGEYIGFPDDDCWYESDAIAQIRCAFAAQQFGELDGVVGSWVEQHEAIGGQILTGLLSYPDWQNFKGGNATSISLFFRKNVLVRLGGFDERFGVGKWFGAAEETDLILRALASGSKVQHSPRVRIHHAFSPSQSATLAATCRAMRRRGRGTGGIYSKHRMRSWVILRGVVGQVVRPLQEWKWREAVVGVSVSIGLLEGWLKWQLTER